jgi:hypothetical protein
MVTEVDISEVWVSVATCAKLYVYTSISERNVMCVPKGSVITRIALKPMQKKKLQNLRYIKGELGYSVRAEVRTSAWLYQHIEREAGYLSDHNLNQWQYSYTEVKLEFKTKLRGFSPPAKYTDRETVACRRS